MDFIYDDGGRQAAGFKGVTGDCGVRAVAIITDLPYLQVYNEINQLCKLDNQKKRKNRSGKSSSRTGLYRSVVDTYLKNLGYKWIPCMTIGSGCKIHLKSSELPNGNILVRLSRHFATVKNGILHDIYDSSRNETRCVYGYYIKEQFNNLIGEKK